MPRRRECLHVPGHRPEDRAQVLHDHHAQCVEAPEAQKIEEEHDIQGTIALNHPQFPQRVYVGIWGLGFRGYRV